jgi:5-methylcytosine-specific restriction endonuclease McrA
MKTRRAVFQKYSCCQFQGSKAEDICGSRYKLEIEHLHPLWAGGSHDFENLTVLCANHNKFKYQQQSSML